MRRRFAVTLATLLTTAGAALAQANEVTQAQRSHASMMILLVVVGGLAATYLLMWVLRRQGKLPEEKPLPKPRWTHPEDEGR